jgi:hypothetical protein
LNRHSYSKVARLLPAAAAAAVVIVVVMVVATMTAISEQKRK